MKLCKTIEDIQAINGQQQTVALVPTMGNLHDGHLSLIKTAKKYADKIVVSLFVNPLQFGPNEDFANYPRTFDADWQKLEKAGVDAVFAPTPEILYPPSKNSATLIDLPELTTILCAKARPTHFQGVLVVVAKLFNIVRPQVAVFGEKDFQQLTAIKTMVANLNFSIDIVGSATIREADGLAMSSRNHYLTGEEREKAPLLYATLCQLKQVMQNNRHSYATLEKDATETLNSQGFQTDYVAIRNKSDLSLPEIDDKNLIILAAAKLGKARLIDNIFV